MPLPAPGRVVEALRRSTAFVSSTLRNRAGTGSAIVLTNETLVTNAHVVVGGDLQVESWEGKTAAATVLQIDRPRDLALLRAPGLGAPPASLADSEAVRPGTPVIAVGNPIGFKGAASTGTVHAAGPIFDSGAASVLHRQWICADIHLAPGNSGGPLADWEGRVIGVNTMVLYGGLALAIPSRALQAFLMRNKRRSLGVTLRAIRLGAQKIGLMILEMTPGGAAASASLLQGDILVGANGKPFSYIDDLEAVLALGPEPLLTLEFRRGGVEKGRRVTLQWTPEAGHNSRVIRIAIVARNALLAEETAALLAGEEQLEIVDIRISPRLLPLGQSLCDVVLTAALPEPDAQPDGPPVVALTDAPFRAFPGLHSPHALLPMSARSDEIIAALFAAASGLFVLTADQVSTVASRPTVGESFGIEQEKLTPRELEVLRMLADGLPNKAIALALRISDHTVKFHVSQILAKLNAASRTEAVTAAIRAGLLFV